MAYIKNTIKNVQGSNISIDDALFKKDIQLYGDTYQYTTTGKNLFDTGTLSTTTDGGVTFTPYYKNNELQYINVNGTATANVFYQLKKITLPAGTYILNGCTGGNTNTYQLAVGFASIGRQSATDGDKSFTLSQQETMNESFIRIQNGVTVNNVKIYPMIRLSSVSDSSYEPYTNGASPNPDYPQNIEVVTGRQIVKVVGKNLLPKGTSVTRAGVTYTVNDDGSITINGTSTGGSYIDIYHPGQTDIASDTTKTYTYTKGIANTDIGLDFFEKINGSWVSKLYTYNESATFTPNEARTAQQARIFAKTGVAINNVTIYPMVVEGTNPGNYKPYQEQNYEINLGKNLYDPSYRNNGGFNAARCNVTEENGLFTFEATGNDMYIWNVKSAGASYSENAGQLYEFIDDDYTFSLTNSAFKTNYITYYDENKVSLGYIEKTTSNIVTISKSDKVGAKYFSIRTGVNNSVSGTTYTTYMQLEKGTQATSYSRYFTPIELAKISTYKDRIFKSSGKNLLDTDKMITFQGTVASRWWWIDGVYATDPSNLYYEVQAGKTYTISILTKANVTKTQGIYKINGVESQAFAIEDNNTSATFTPSVTTNLYVRVNITNANTDTYCIVQLEEGNQATSFEPYGKDWYIEKNTRKLELAIADMNNGTDYPGWRGQTQLAEYFPNINAALSSQTQYVCNITTWNRGGISINTTSGNRPLFLTKTAFGLTQDQWKAQYPNLIFELYYGTPYPYYEKITNTELITQLETIQLLEGVNNISISSGNLSSILDLTYYSQENPYADVIYSQDDENDIKIWFNDVELENAAEYVEALTMTSRILPNDGKKIFSLSNFVSKELELTIHDIDLEDIQDQVKISIGTLINGSYDYIPIGVFSIQDTPVNNHDKYVIKLRDNRVEFDFNYNAEPLIESLGGTATKKQILDDICLQANIENSVEHFDGEDDEIGVYDNTVTANRYIAYLAEQGGYIPTIDRDGKLKFVDLNNLYVWKVPLTLMSDDYKLGTSFEIKRIVYESGVIKYETSSDETLDTLYLDAANPYITTQEQIDNIFAKLQNFKIDSVTTNNFLGNPAIDPYDIIEVYGYYDNNDNFVDDKSVVVFRTLANMFYTFNGKHAQTIDTQIGVEARTENVTKNSEATFRKWAKTEIDNNESKINLESGRIDELGGTVSQLEVDNTSINARIQKMSKNIDENGNITEITTTNGYTFNSSGLNIYTSENDFNTQITNTAVKFKDGERVISETNKDGVTSKDFKQQGLHQYSWDGDSYDFSDERVEIDGEIGYATFYNGDNI